MLGELGNVAVGVGDYGAAFALYEETAASFRSLGHEARPRLAQVLGNMGALATMQGDAERGRELSEAALEIQLEVGNTEAAAMTLHNLARIDLEAGRLQAAADLLRRSLEAAEEIGYREVFAYCLEGFAEIATADGDLERAARLLGASDVLFDELGAVKMGDEKKTYEQTVRALRERLGEAAFESARAAGRALTLEEATRLALASTASSPAGAGSGRRAGAPDPARGRSSP